ncbi:MAG TPA: SDR family NAD(P)-dependent oxidoreductase, partial [Baekduia sp.]|nr:SDR family NAD(P)-dependent oxidoreductase [Baekduia sp.]
MIAVITGASSGIGEATARRLAREPGTRLVLVARRRELMEQLVTEIGGDHVIVDVDLTADDAPAKVRDAIEQQCGGG